MNEKIRIIGEDDKNRDINDFYVTFKEKLEETHTFPSVYIFKFIVPSEQDVIAELHSIFKSANADISTRSSKTGKYTSLTIKAHVRDADDVILYYRQVSAIKGVIML